jgi:hypothetical protein
VRSSPEVSELAHVHPPDTFVYRVARGPNPFAPPYWELASEEDGTFGNRFDDPGALPDPSGRRSVIPSEARFRVVYCSTQRAGAFGETLARFRPSLATLAMANAIQDDEPPDPSLQGNSIPADWRFNRRIGWMLLDPSLEFVDFNHASTMTHLRTKLALLLDSLGLDDLDLSAITSQNRRLTQEAARYVYELVDENGNPAFAGIRYISRLHEWWECWAIFHDRLQHRSQSAGTILPDDPGLIEAALALGIRPPKAF